MGWFWADPIPKQQWRKPASAQRSNAAPPPECPMHKPSGQSPPLPLPSDDSACPYKPPTSDKHPSTPAGASQSSPSAAPSYVSRLNPLNYMPSNLSNERQASQQSVSLPLEREGSSIPRGDGSGNWEYPSPQQMYNAMLRKGYTDTPAEHVESMVAVHNFLNEGAWEEIKEWESRFAGGLSRGWELSRQGEEGAARQAALDEMRRRRRGEETQEPRLVRFMGRPSEPTPKARLYSIMAWLYPAGYANNPPFDRHDWYVQRQTANGQSKEVRYVIDYYSGPPEPTGEPVFFLDVRPAIDGPTAACERLLRWGGDVWYRASGASVREQMLKEQNARQRR